MYHHPFSGVAALAKSNLSLSVCQGVLSCDWVSHIKCLCAAWLTSQFFACWDCLNRVVWLSLQRAVVQISSSALSKSATRLMVRISSWQHLVWWWEVTLFTLGDWRLSQGLPSNFSSVTACGVDPGWFDMQQKMQTVSRASGKALSPCIQDFLRGQPVGMKMNYLSGRNRTSAAWQNRHLCYIAAVSLPLFNLYDKDVGCSRRNCYLQMRCLRDRLSTPG